MKNEVQKVSIMEIPFVNSTKEKFIEEQIIPCFHKKKRCFIVTANPEIVMETRRNNAYKKIVQSADYVLPDGIGILLAAKCKKTPLKERIAGFDVMQDLLAFANETEASCFFLGTTEEMNKLAVENIQKKYPKLKVAGRHHGFIDLEDEKVIEYIQKTEPDFIFVALGFPKQEEWIYHHINKLKKGICIGVGGSLDVFAGKVKRAPDIWIKLNLEWLYRIVKQPFRIKRMLPLLKFIWLVLIKKNL